VSGASTHDSTASTSTSQARASRDRRRHWRDDAACADADPDLFFPDDMKSARVNIRLAKLICRGCQVNAACLSLALAGHEAGVWGGLTEDERRRWPAPSARSS
jgi:WhiB family redox-sensing transcriptional regulator